MTHAPALGRGIPAWLVILGALTAIGPLSIDMYLPAFAALERDLGARGGSAELTLATFFIGMACGQLLWGPLSDRFGRKPPLYAGLGLFVLASIGCALANDIVMLTFWRGLQALSGAAGLVITRAMVRDRCGARDAARAFSLLILVMGLAPILAPMLGGWIHAVFGWRAIFLILAGFGLACMLAIRFGLPESHDIRHQPPLDFARVLRDYREILANRPFLGYTLSGGLAMAGMFAYIAGSPFVLIQLGGIPPEHFGWAFGLNALGFVAASQINARWLNTRAPSWLLRRALWLPALSGLSLLLLVIGDAASLPLTLLCLFVYVASLGFVAPNASANALATHGQRAGTAAALLGAVQFALATLASVAISLLHDGSTGPLAAMLALCGVSAWLAHRLLVGAHERHQASHLH